jgi:MFS family permease
VPESEKWREATSKEAARKVGVAEIFKGKQLRLTIMGALLGTMVLLGTWGSVQWIPSWGHKLAGEAGISQHAVRESLQIAIASGAILFSILAAWLADKFNRRIIFFAMSLASLVACGILFRLPIEYGNVMLFWTFLVGGLTASFFGWLPLYLPELFPTRLRATGTGFSYNAGRVLAALGTLGAGTLLAAFSEDYARMCSVISLVYVFGLVLIWFAPETKGKPLPE